VVRKDAWNDFYFSTITFMVTSNSPTASRTTTSSTTTKTSRANSTTYCTTAIIRANSLTETDKRYHRLYHPHYHHHHHQLHSHHHYPCQHHNHWHHSRHTNTALINTTISPPSPLPYALLTPPLSHHHHLHNLHHHTYCHEGHVLLCLTDVFHRHHFTHPRRQGVQRASGSQSLSQKRH